MLTRLGDAKKEQYRALFRTESRSEQPERRAAALTALSKLPSTPEDKALLRKAALSDTELYVVVESALRALSSDIAANQDAFRHQVAAPSFRDRLAATVVNILARSQQDAAAPALIDATDKKHNRLVRILAIDGLAKIALDSAPVHERLMALLTEESAPTVQSAAIRALRDRKDNAALPALHNLAKNAKDASVRETAQSAADTLEGK